MITFWLLCVIIPNKLNIKTIPQVQTSQHIVDSLNMEMNKNKQLIIQKDSSINIYKDSIQKLQTSIENETIKFIEIQHNYYLIRNNIQKYTPTEVDSFFKQRYKY